MKNFLENYKFLTIVLIATVFGIASGIVGQILSRAYLLEKTFDVPLFTEIDFRGSNSRGNGLVISNPKKVVVEQNEKVGDIVSSAPKSIASIFKKIDKKPLGFRMVGKLKFLNQKTESKSDDKEAFSLDNYYKLADSLGEAFIITSDGWLIANYTPVAKNTKATTSRKLSTDIVSSYVIVHDGRVYDIDSIVVAPDLNYSFWKINAHDLTVKEIVGGDKINNGKILVGVDKMGRVEIGTVKDVLSTNSGIVRSSDNFHQEVVFSEKLETGSFFFDLAGGFVGFVGDDNRLELLSGYSSAIENLLSGEEISKPFFGIDYIMLSDLIGLKAKEVKTGALIYQNKSYAGVHKDSVASRMGLKVGDIIKNVNNIEINKNNDLAYVLSSFKKGDNLDIELIRNGDEISVEYTIE